ncbi:zinc knuckle, partial [Ostertagia ostertagi]
RTPKKEDRLRTVRRIGWRFPTFVRAPNGPSDSPSSLRDYRQHNLPNTYFPNTSNVKHVIRHASILSKLDLPIFEGNLLEFPEYWARFSTLIGDKPQLDGATKFSLLKSTLRGRALQTIKGLAITAANYPIAVEILKNHFEDRVTTRHILYTRLASLPSCDNEGKNLFALYSQMFAMVRQFTTYEDDSKEYALGAILLNKLPRHIRSRVYDHTGNSENLVPTQLLHILTKIVRKEAVLEEMADRSNFYSDFLMNAAFQNKKPQSRRSEPQLPTRKRQLQKTCKFCGDIAHNSSTCTTYKTPRERVKVIKTKHLCYNCLSPRHATKQCPSKNSCIHCSKRHHSSVCFTQNPAGQAIQRLHRPMQLRPPPLAPRLPLHRSNATIENPNQDNISAPTEGGQRQRLFEVDYNKQQHQKPEETPRVYAADIINANVTSKASLMMCVPITLYNPDQPLLRLDTTAFFDSGASTTIIKKDIAQRLNLNMEEEQLISFQTFAKREPQSHMSSKVKVGLLLENYEQIVLHVRTLPFIMEPMQMELLNQHQRDDTKTWSVNTQPGLLIGSDYFWELMLSDNFYIKQLPNGYNLIHSRLGNIITGKPLPSHRSFVTISDADDVENPLQHQKLEEIVEKFWSLESAGISDEIARSDDDKCLQEFTDTIHFDLDEGRYVLDLPIRESYIWSDSKAATTTSFHQQPHQNDKKERSDIRIEICSRGPADTGSRGLNVKELLESKLWFSGPEFLHNSEKWPKDISHVTDELDVEKELFASASINYEPLFEEERFSTWTKLLNTIVLVLLFAVRKSSKAKDYFSDKRSHLIAAAEIIVCRQAQLSHPPDDTTRQQLNLYYCKDTLLWKSQGRINNAKLPPHTIEPVYLPRQSYISSLYILHVHQINHHCGVEQTLCEIRTKIWIPKGRQTVKKTINNNCYMCRKAKSKPYALPDFPIHPRERVTRPQYPFERCGIDYMGPFQYRVDNLTISKYWIVLITCLNTRAIVTDIVTSMSAIALLHVMRRFIATNGFPRWIVCDNAKVCLFKTKENDTTITDYCANRKIQFHFIASHSPWQGGIYERMVGLFKASYRSAVGKDIYDIETLKTLVAECAAICNCRPLTYVNDELLHIPLRPVDFLRPTAIVSIPRIERIEETQANTNIQSDLIEMWQSTQEILDFFWKRWSKEYILSLREQYQRSHKHPRLEHKAEHPNLHDYVIIQDDTLKRGQWKLGQVVGSNDEYQRTVQLRLANKE